MGALQSGVSGMLAHQVRMDSIGNNIANSNTIGFKSSHVLFAESMYQLLRAGTSPSDNFPPTRDGCLRRWDSARL
jgi:flagellar hook protein FlgE